MIQQTVLPFKLEITRDTITSHAGLALLGEFCMALKLPELVDRYLPKPGSGAGYQPSEYIFPLVLMGHLAENGLLVGDEFREGNEAPAARNLKFLKHCVAQMPKGKHICSFRADSAAYQADIINYCNRNGSQFAIGADLDEAVVRAIKAISESPWSVDREGHIAETVHCMNRSEESFRINVLRRPYQRALFDDDKEAVRYTAIASNREGSPAEVLSWYNQRGEAGENRIKDLKIGFGMERMPCGQTAANAVFFRIGTMAYNIYRLFLLKALDVGWHKYQVQTIRWRLYQSAGKIVAHANRLHLKVRRSLYRLFAKIRLRIWEFANT